MKWIKCSDRLPDDNQYILILCSLEFCEDNIALGRFRKNNRNKFPNRVQLQGGMGNYSTYISIDSIQYWIPIRDLKDIKFT